MDKFNSFILPSNNFNSFSSLIIKLSFNDNFSVIDFINKSSSLHCSYSASALIKSFLYKFISLFIVINSLITFSFFSKFNFFFSKSCNLVLFNLYSISNLELSKRACTALLYASSIIKLESLKSFIFLVNNSILVILYLYLLN